MRIRKINGVVSFALMAVALFSVTVSASAEIVSASVGTVSASAEMVSASAGADTIGSIVEIDKSGNAGEQVLTAEESEILGSISVRLEDTSENRTKKGVVMGVVKVADVSGGQFEMDKAYASSGVDLNNIRNANELVIAATKLVRNAAAGEADQIITTDADGTAKTEALPVGVYLLYAVDTAQYEDISPALVSIPTFDDKKGEMVYDIEVLPKHTVPHQEGERSIPQTGMDEKILEYGLISLGFLIAAILAGVVALLVKGKKKKAEGSMQL